MARKPRKSSDKPKSGNGYWGRQSMYILLNAPLVWVIKVGISGDAEDRARDISNDKKNPGRDILLCSIEVYGAYAWEQLHHFLMWIFRWRWWFKGTGKTERFFAFVLIFTLFIFIIAAVVDLIILNIVKLSEIAAYIAIEYMIYSYLIKPFLQ